MLRFNTPFAARAAVAVPLQSQSLRYIAQMAGAAPKANTPAAVREKFDEKDIPIRTTVKNRAAAHDQSAQPLKPRTPTAILEPKNLPDDQISS
jgi:hypothetical protein